MRRALAIIAVLAIATAACGGEATLNVADAWARPAIGPNGAVYLTIDGGPADNSLTAASAPTAVAASVELHQTVIRDDGTMGMVRMDGVDVPAEATVMMVPGGLHVMLIDLAKPLELGESFDLVLTFADGTELETTVEIRDE